MERSSTVRYTYADHQAIPEDHRRHEIIDGELVVTPTPRFKHQVVAHDLAAVLLDLARNHGLGEIVGPITVHVHDHLVLEPDIVFIRRDRLHILDPDGHVHGAPDLVVEILSPSNAAYDRNVKRKRYLENGVPEVWIVDVDERTVEVWRAGEPPSGTARDSLSWDVGGSTFEIALEDVFRGVRDDRRRGRADD